MEKQNGRCRQMMRWARRLLPDISARSSAKYRTWVAVIQRLAVNYDWLPPPVRTVQYAHDELSFSRVKSCITCACTRKASRGEQASEREKETNYFAYAMSKYHVQKCEQARRRRLLCSHYSGLRVCVMLSFISFHPLSSWRELTKEKQAKKMARWMICKWRNVDALWAGMYVNA